MLTTSTGEAMLDSGGAYGRHWQRNQKKSFKDFMNEPQVSYDIDTWTPEGKTPEYEITYTISLFHYLTNGHYELDLLCNEYNTLKCKDWDGFTYGVSKDQEQWLKAHGVDTNIDNANSWNSYNGDSMLSQVIQGTNIEINGDEYVLLQIHQGCDVRGGYTDAKLFKVVDYALEGVYGTIDGVDVSNRYDGYHLTSDENDKEIKVNKDSKVSLYLGEY